MREWDFKVQAYYADVYAENKRLGQLAMETTHIGRHSMEIEVAVFLKRTDIAFVWITDLETGKTERRT